MTAVTNGAGPVTLSDEVERIRDAVRRMGRDTDETRADPFVARLVKRIGDGRVQLCEHLVVLHADADQRNAPADDLDALWQALRALCDRLRDREAVTTDDLRVLMREEARLEGIANDAQMRYALEQSPAALDVAARATRMHRDALCALDDAMQRALYVADLNATERAA